MKNDKLRPLSKVVCASNSLKIQLQSRYSHSQAPLSELGRSSKPHRATSLSKMALNKNRPVSHFSPPHSWSNDPCGAVFIPETREYLLGYQWHPGTCSPGNSAWGLGKSKNLITWIDCTPPICNGVETLYDAAGVFSGSIASRVVDGKRVLYLFYTSVSVTPIHWSINYIPGCESQSVAISTDYGKSWQRHQNNPLLLNPSTGEATTGWRDPFVSTWENLSKLRNVPLSTSYMLLGSGEKGRGPQLLIYESQDLLDWKPVSTLLRGDQDAPILPGSKLGFGRNFECPSFFAIGHQNYLICGIEEDSTLTNRHAARYTLWMSGNLRVDPEGRPSFEVDGVGRLDHGILYAAHIFRGPDNEILQLGWADEEMNNMQHEQGWAGCLALPREISELTIPIPRSLPSDMNLWKINASSGSMTTLGIKPSTQTKGLRSGSRHFNLSSLPDLRSRNFEIRAKFTCLCGDETLVINVRQSPDDREVTRIVVALISSSISVDRAASSLSNGNKVHDRGSFELLNRGSVSRPLFEDLDLKIFVDNSVIEVYANDRFALTSRVYPSLIDSTRVSVDFRTADGLTQLEKSRVGLDCWADLAVAWPGRQIVEHEDVSENNELRNERMSPILSTQSVAG